VLLADDFGKADEALARLSLIRREAATVRADRWDGNPTCDRQSARSLPPAGARRHELVTNHPRVLTATGGDTVFSFSGADAVSSPGTSAPGRYVVCPTRRC